MATSVTAQWLAHRPGHRLGQVHVRPSSRRPSATFGKHYSLALQQTLYAMGDDGLNEQPQIAEFRFSLPNKHHFVFDLSPYGVENKNEVFHADDRPYGYMRAPSSATTPRTPA